ncbi:hypothetical protein QJS10_CPB17g01557 [Acorus calamus]|uniref:Uncharacterized protein n=1 Tax=Acorus calamus TaxID=4465 RepID=A0AAV9CRV0_ACOCL|nr:hypothetical protein QJS10_CPB17g01557 [Acorus calamus]
MRGGMMSLYCWDIIYSLVDVWIAQVSICSRSIFESPVCSRRLVIMSVPFIPCLPELVPSMLLLFVLYLLFGCLMTAANFI